MPAIALCLSQVSLGSGQPAQLDVAASPETTAWSVGGGSRIWKPGVSYSTVGFSGLLVVYWPADHDCFSPPLCFQPLSWALPLSLSSARGAFTESVCPE